MFCLSFRSQIVHPRDAPTYPIRAETFPGAACLTRFPVTDASMQISRDRLLRAKAAPLQGLDTINSPSVTEEPSPDCFFRQAPKVRLGGES
jgi:hypothetical protein